MEDYYAAKQDFRKARNRAALQELLSRITGKSTELLSYEDVRRKVRASGIVSRRNESISLDAIAGSVGRYNDFNRDFLPLQDSDAERWAKVKVATTDLTGLPPVDVYQIGEVYFVLDGHHRISVAREMGSEEIDAFVTEIRSKVPLTPDIETEALILTAEYAEFLDTTDLDHLRPEAKLEVTKPGQYQKLLEYIDVHRYFMGLESEREIPYEEAVISWYDTVYLPVINIIDELGIMQDFPARTKTDLYLWIGRHRADIEELLGWEISYSSAAVDLADQHSPRFSRRASRIGRKVLDVVVPDDLEPGPPGGQWRQEKLVEKEDEGLFANILVPLSTEDVSWLALEQAFEVVDREGGRINGLFIVENEEQMEGEEVKLVKDRFYWRCGEVQFDGEFNVAVGPIAKTICERARWSDLVVINLTHPPESDPIGRLGSGFRRILRRCSRPVLAVPGQKTSLSHPLLAYDGRPKAREAIYVAAYLAGRWQLPLSVVTVTGVGDVTEETLDEAHQYLDKSGVKANYRSTDAPTAESILEVATEENCDWLIMGGYGANPVVEVVRGAVTEELLNSSSVPMLICP